MKKYTIIFAFLLSSTLTFAQDELFKVLVTKGDNKFTSPTNTVAQALLVGKKLSSTDKVIIGTGGYLGLAHKSGKTIELKTPGTYDITKLVGQVNTQNASVSEKYVNYVAGQMTSSNEDLAANRHKYMAVTGSVERGTEKIKPIAPTTATVLDELAVLKWNAVKIASTKTFAKAYIVTITNMFDDVLSTQETTDTEIVIDLNKLNLKTEKNLVWTVKVKEDPTLISDKYNLQYVSDDSKATQLHNQFATLKSELGEETALNKLVLASFCADNKLTLNAMEYYEEAIKMEPDVDEYKVLYGKYMEQSGLAK
jgi:hypothetical protein